MSEQNPIKDNDDKNVQLVRITEYPQSKKPHILGASSNLLGICFVLITGIRLTNTNIKTYADEICLSASFMFLMSCLLSYLAIRKDNTRYDYEKFADYAFILGMFTLFLAVCIFSIDL